MRIKVILKSGAFVFIAAEDQLKEVVKMTDSGEIYGWEYLV